MKQAVADNYQCAAALYHFKKDLLDPLHEKTQQAQQFIFEKGYEKWCAEKKIEPSDETRKTMLERYNENSNLFRQYQAIYEAVDKLITRHEAVIEKLASIYVLWRDKILWKEKMPSGLMKQQQEIMDEFYKAIETILEPCKQDLDLI